MAGEVVLRTLKHAWVTLESLHIPVAVMGGIALSAWKHVRVTRDVDLLVGIGATDINILMQRLAEAKIRPKRQPPVLTLGPVRIVQVIYEPPGFYVDLQIDLLLAESKYQLEAIARRVPARFPDLDIEVSILSCEDLILFKLLAGRIIDRADSAVLLRANRARLDLGYLLYWIRELDLAKELAEIWDEAFPGEQPPAAPTSTPPPECS